MKIEINIRKYRQRIKVMKESKNMNYADRKAVLEAQKIVQQTPKQVKENSILNHLAMAKHSYVFFPEFYQAYFKYNQQKQNYYAGLKFVHTGCRGSTLDTPLYCKYSSGFVHLKELHRYDKLSLVGEIKKHHNKKGYWYQLINVKHVRFINAPEDMVLRQYVPSKASLRVGYTMVQTYPPMTNKNGKLILNYPPLQKQYIIDFLKWLRNK